MSHIISTYSVDFYLYHKTSLRWWYSAWMKFILIAKTNFSCHCWYTGQICKKRSKFRAASFFFEFWINIIIHHNIDRLHFCDQLLLSLFTTQGDFEVLLLLYISNVVVRNDYLLHLLAPKDSRQKCYFFLF